MSAISSSELEELRKKAQLAENLQQWVNFSQSVSRSPLSPSSGTGDATQAGQTSIVKSSAPQNYGTFTTMTADTSTSGQSENPGQSGATSTQRPMDGIGHFLEVLRGLSGSSHLPASSGVSPTSVREAALGASRSGGALEANLGGVAPVPTERSVRFLGADGAEVELDLRPGARVVPLAVVGSLSVGVLVFLGAGVLSLLLGLPYGNALAVSSLVSMVLLSVNVLNISTALVTGMTLHARSTLDGSVSLTSQV